MEGIRISSFLPKSSIRQCFSQSRSSFLLPLFGPINRGANPRRVTNYCSPQRNLSVVSGSKSESSISMQKGSISFLRSVLSCMEKIYLGRNPSAAAILRLIDGSGEDHVCYDHIAFRTFGVNGHGIDAVAEFFVDYGYSPRNELSFPAKKLRAVWFSPPGDAQHVSGSRIDGPLPRVFISELLVDQLSSEAQAIIHKHTEVSHHGCKFAALASALGYLTWEKPSFSEYQHLARESEYGAWTLVNGYTLNHVTVSVHQLGSLQNICSFNNYVVSNGFKLNSEGGVLKVSPDGLLLQSSTVADLADFHFADGKVGAVPCSYIEFAERLVLPEYRGLPVNEIKEFHRRDGFEVGNAENIFESTSATSISKITA